MKEEQNNIIIYNTDDGLSSVVLVSSDGMVWLSQMDMDNSITETRATRRQADDSRTDGIGATRLSFPTVGFHIDFLAVNHSEVTSDTNCLARLFLTEDYCKALSRAVLFSYGNSHEL